MMKDMMTVERDRLIAEEEYLAKRLRVVRCRLDRSGGWESESG
jgi:hypothetical protein